MGDMRLIVAGAAGRMGRALIALIAASEGVTLVGALEAPQSAAVGQD
ncbi:MAG: 4-hydroxy-tetrahydrodipicolinate reductase, partial [Methylovirgula sp.]